MLKMIVTGAFVSKGYDNAAPLRFSENGESVRFRIGKSVYDKKAENEKRWINFNAKAFGPSCERIRKMQLKEGSNVNLVARYDEETWLDKTTGEIRSAPVLIIDEIEYASAGHGKEGSSNEESATPAQGHTQTPQESPPSDSSRSFDMPGNFTGFEGFDGGKNPFFTEEQ